MRLIGDQLLRLSLADLLDEWPIAVAVVLAIAAVLSPLLALNGLRVGVIGEIFERLRADPIMRRITLDATGAGRFDDQWFRTIRARPDVVFVLPATRFAAAQVDMTPAAGGSVSPLRISLVPTGPGDPVFAPASPPLRLTTTAVKLSAVVAARAGLKLGDRLFLDVERRRADGRVEAVGVEATVADIARHERHGGLVAFVHPDLLLAIEAFRDGFAAPAIGVPSGRPRAERNAYPNFRLYARRIEDVAGLAAYLRDQHDLSVGTRQAQIAATVALNNNVGAVLEAVVILGMIGLAGSLAAIQWAVAARKRRTVAMLNLIGYGRRWLIGFPCLQAVLLAAAGTAVAAALAFAAAAWINQYFAQSFGATGAACVIRVLAILRGAGAVLLFSLAPAAVIGVGFTRMDPSDEIRDM